jgi:opacity protein-like surface antigen
MSAISCHAEEDIPDWNYYLTGRAFEKWLGKEKKKLNINFQVGARKDNVRYEADLKLYHPIDYTFNESKEVYSRTKNKQRHIILNGLYDFPITEKISFSPFVGIGMHITKMVKDRIELKLKEGTDDTYTKEHRHIKGTKKGFIYNFGTEFIYSLTEQYNVGIGWQYIEYLNAKLSGKNYDEQKLYVKVGLNF